MKRLLARIFQPEWAQAHDEHEDHDDTPAQEKRWKKRAKYVCGGVLVGTVVAGAAVAVTLVATRREAQRENLIAYLRGQANGLKQGGWSDGWTAAEEWFAEHGLEELAEPLAQKS